MQVTFKEVVAVAVESQQERGKKLDLDAMFKPRSIALVGASSNFAKLSGRPLRFLIEYGYKGKIYPINPNYPEIAGLKCYPNIAAVPGEIDLAVVGMAAAGVPAVIRECAAKGVKAVTVFSAGFAEMGAEGKAMQAALRQAAIDGNVALDGPNCAGLVGVRDKVIATFNSAMDRGSILEGPVSFVAQSGALGTYMFAAAQDAGVGFDYWVSTGNEAVLGFPDFVSYFVRQATTRTIIGYMEDARDGEAFKAAALEALEAGKPLIILKVGTSESGAKAASSHTGALAGSDRVYDTMFNQCGVLRAREVEDLFDLANISNAPHYPKGPGTAMMTISGGAGILMCDRCEEFGLRVVQLERETMDALRNVLPPFASPVNPVDVSAELITTPGFLKRSMEIVLGDPNVDSLVIFLGMQLHSGAELAGDIVEAAASTDKMVAVNWIAAPRVALDKLRENNVPVFSDPARGIRSLGALVKYVSRRERFLAKAADPSRAREQAVTAPYRHDSAKVAKARAIVDQARKEGRKALTEGEGKAILEIYGIATPGRKLATNAAEAVKAAEGMGFPVVMKISSADITHKTEAGGVRLGIKDAKEAAAAYDDIIAKAKVYNPKAKLDGVLVEEMIGDAVQVIVGFKQDPRFGPVVTFGMGGIFVELIRDFALRCAPFDEDEALAMIQETKAYPLLTGFRGDKKRDVAALAKVILAAGQLALDCKDDLAELDINPVMVLREGQGAKAVDALLVLN
ncbi:MAG: acetate--CoA ligase family protein [Acidobacteria bacterium]|nr:acetate--CoA ligase family protein [Acidobacteriota bacterium]